MNERMPSSNEANPAEITPAMDRSEEAMTAASELVRENEILASNSRVQELLANGFHNDEGEPLDPGNFLAAMLAYIETQQTAGEEVSQDDVAERVARLEESLVAHSARPEVEAQREKWN